MSGTTTTHTLRRNIAGMLDRSGMSLNSFAQVSNIPYSTLQRLLSADGSETSPRLSTLEDIARALGTQIADLFADEAPKPPPPSANLAKQVGRLVEDFLSCPTHVRARILYQVEQLAEKHGAG